MGMAAAVIGGSLASAGASLWGSNKALEAQKQATAQAQAMQMGMFNRADQALEPFIGAGKDVLPTLKSLLTPGPNQTQTLSQLPGFQFAQDWGRNAVQNLGSTHGWGGNTLTAGANYATGLAQQGFGGLVGNLQNFANMGAGAGGALAGNAVTAGNAMGTNLTGLGNAGAGAAMTQANALGGIGGNISNLAMLNQLSGGKLFGGGNMYGTNDLGLGRSGVV